MKTTALLCTAALLLVGVLAGAAPAAAADTVVIGLGLAESGPLAYLSGQYRKGYQAAIALANRDGKIKFELVARDHKGIPSEAVAVAKRLIERDGAKVIDVALPSTVVIAVQPVSHQARVPLIGGYTYVPGAVREDLPYFFRTSTNSELVGVALGKVIHGVQGNKTIAMLAPNDDYGRSAIEWLEKALVGLGSPRVVHKDYYERNQTDFSAILLKMKSLNPDSLYIDVRYPASVTVLKQMTEIGFSRPLFSSVNFYNNKLAAEAGRLLEGAAMSVDWAPVFADPVSRAFIESYKSLHNEVPDSGSAQGWTAAMTAIKAIQAAGAGATSQQIRDAMRKLDFQAPTGRITFDKRGDARVPTHILLYKDAAYHPLQ